MGKGCSFNFFGTHILAFFLVLSLCGNLISADIPNCKYEDTVDLTNAVKHQNGGYNYQHIFIPHDQTGYYNYELLENGKRIEVPEHVRGCACKIKGCIKFCCHHLERKIDEQRECTKERKTDLDYNSKINVTFSNGTTQIIDVIKEYLVQEGLPCAYTFPLSPQEDPLGTWKLFENGTLLREIDMKYMSRLDYCFAPHKVNETYYLNPLNCLQRNEPTKEITRNNIAMIISIPLLLLTIFVYAFIPELHSLHNKCFICYLICLTIAYTLLAFLNLSGIVFSPGACVFIGFLLYFALIAAIIWLSVISFDFWSYFKTTMYVLSRKEQNSKFLKYSLFAWGLTAFLTIATYLAQASGLSDDLKPGINEHSCWINTRSKTAFYYFYGPILMFLLLNLTFFVLTLIRVIKMKKEFDRTSNSLQNFLKQKNTFELFCRLFVVMGINWILEVASYIFASQGKGNWFFDLADLYNSLQGIIIFILFVLNARVLSLVNKRFFRCERDDREIAQSPISNTVPEEVPMRNVEDK